MDGKCVIRNHLTYLETPFCDNYINEHDVLNIDKDSVLFTIDNTGTTLFIEHNNEIINVNNFSKAFSL